MKLNDLRNAITKRRIFCGLIILSCMVLTFQWLRMKKFDNCLTGKDLTEVVNLTYLVAQALDHFNETYWIDHGCLLGAARMGRMMPHDYDCDFGRLAKRDENDFHSKLSTYLKKRGVTSYRVPELKHGKVILKKDWYQVDIFQFLPDPDGVTMSCGIDSRSDSKLVNLRYASNYYWQSFLPMYDFFPVQKIPFNGRRINAPRRVWSVIKRRFPYTYWFTHVTCQKAV